MREHLEVVAVAGTVGQPDVERGAHLADRVVPLAVHRERVDRLVALENRRRAVALVDVEIDHEGTAQPALCLEHPDGDRDVVQQAEPFAVAGERVMRAPGQVAREAVPQSEARGLERALHGQPGAPQQARGPRHAEHPLLRGGEAGPEQLVDVSRIVHPLEVGTRRLVRLQYVGSADDPAFQQPIAYPRVLAHRERVPRRQREDVVRVMEDLHGSGL
jgi:hypothetical protein